VSSPAGPRHLQRRGGRPCHDCAGTGAAHVGGGRGSRRHPQIAVTDGRGGPTCCARVTA